MAPKKAATASEDTGPAKKQKVQRKAPASADAKSIEFNPAWKTKKPSLLYLGETIKPNEKVACFDMDGTIIEWVTGQQFSLEWRDCQWFNPGVPAKIKEIHEAGHKIVVFTNQASIKSALDGKASCKLRNRVDQMIKGLGVPVTVLVATQKKDDDPYRKPKPGMWEVFVQECNGGVEVDKAASYYCGNAAGRPDDHDVSDKEFAEAVGLPFKVPEDVFGPSAPAVSSGPNGEMIDALKELGNLVRKHATESKDRFKAVAYTKAAKALEDHGEKITSAKEAMKLPGIGKGVGALITEFLETGQMGAEERAALESKEPKEAENAVGGAPKSAGLAFL